MRTAVTVICVSPCFVYPHTPITCFPCISTVSQQVAKDKQPMKGYDQQSNFKGTLFFLHLTNHSPNMKKNIERMLKRREAQISLFLHNGVTHILTGSMNYDANLLNTSSFKAETKFPQCTRSAQMIMACRNSQELKDTIDCSKTAQRLGIKRLTLSNIFTQSDLQLIQIPQSDIDLVVSPDYKNKLVRNWLLQI